MVTRKIVQINEEFCNGCGQCIPNCAEGAIQIIEGKARIVNDSYCDGLGACLGHCPQGALSIIERDAAAFDEKAVQTHLKKAEHKTRKQTTRPQWPVQLNLIPLEAPSYENADLLLMADCVPVAYPGFHTTQLPGKRILIGCPKFDDAKHYATKLEEILKRNNVKSLTVAHMEVPCCSGLRWIAEHAVKGSKKQIPIKFCVITIGGEAK